MAVRNGEKFLNKSLESLLNQSFTDFEIVVVNDASTDMTGKILEEYLKKDSRIRVITNKKNLERCASRNIAINESRGEYIAINDVDDISLKDRLRKEFEYLENNPDVYLVGSRAYILDEKNNCIGKSWGKNKNIEITDTLKEKNVLVHSSVMFRNEDKENFRYREKLRFVEDYDLFLQIVKAGYRIDLLGDFLVNYSDDNDLIFNDYMIKQKYLDHIVKKIFQEKLKYEDLDAENLEKYLPEKLILEMKLKENFTKERFKESREFSKKLIKMDNSFWWKLYFVDSYFNGNLIKMGKRIKRSII